MIGPRGGVRAVTITKRQGADVSRARDALAVEEPLEIRLAWRDAAGSKVTEPLTVTMRTPTSGKNMSPRQVTISAARMGAGALPAGVVVMRAAAAA